MQETESRADNTPRESALEKLAQPEESHIRHVIAVVSGKRRSRKVVALRPAGGFSGPGRLPGGAARCRYYRAEYPKAVRAVSAAESAKRKDLSP